MIRFAHFRADQGLCFLEMPEGLLSLSATAMLIGEDFQDSS